MEILSAEQSSQLPAVTPPGLTGSIINCVEIRTPEIQVFGTDYQTPDGTAIRNYVHVSDLARAHVLAAQYVLGGGNTIAINLASGRGPLSGR